MATAPSLFGATPESIQQARDAALNAQATSYANMDPFQRANFGIYRGANQLGGIVGRMLGGQDPEMEKASQMQQLASQASLSTPEGMMAYARKLQSEGFIEQAFAASQQAQQMQITSLDQTARQQGVNATTASQAQQAAFREAVKTLGPSPTQAQLLSVASQFGDPRTLVASLQVSADKADNLAQRDREFGLRQEENARLQKERLDSQRTQAAEARADRAANLEASRILAASLRGDKPLTEFQGKSLTFGTRAAASSNIITSLEGKYNILSSSYLPAFANSSEGQQALQAQANFVNAVLRQESGAAIATSEFDNAKKQYFPQYGDKPAVIAQKRANREQVIKGFARQAGPGGKDVDEAFNAPVPRIEAPSRGSNIPAPDIPAPDAQPVPQATNRGALGTAGNPIKLD